MSQKRQDFWWVCTIYALLSLASIAGCGTGGVGFVKYTADSKHLIFDSNGACIHQVASGRTARFHGTFACEDATARRWVVEPMPLDWDQRLVLVCIQEDGSVSGQALPALSYPPALAYKAIMAMFGPGEDCISVISFRENIADPHWHAFRLRIGRNKWEEVTAEADRRDLRSQLENRGQNIPSITILGHIPLSDYSFCGRDGSKGKHVECVNETNGRTSSRSAYRLASPDGKTFVTIGYGRAPGSGKLELTDLASGTSCEIHGVAPTIPDLAYQYLVGPCITVVLFPVAIIALNGI